MELFYYFNLFYHYNLIKSIYNTLFYFILNLNQDNQVKNHLKKII